jgi:hypothetical protein
MTQRVFNESQTFRGTWIMYLILLLELPTFLVLVVVLSMQEGEKTDVFIGILIVLLVMGGTFLLIMNLKLETRIDDQTISYRFFPFFGWRKITKSKLVSADVITYQGLTDYGGWGIKGNKTTKAYSIRGDRGLLLDIGEKKKIMIGTQKSDELEPFIASWMEE